MKGLLRARVRIGLAALAVAAAVAGALVGYRHNEKDAADAPEHLDTPVRIMIDAWTHRYPWTSGMLTALDKEGLLTSPARTQQMLAHFQMACVGGKDMVAGQPDVTQRDLSQEWGVNVNMEQAQRLNAAQEQLCAEMPPSAWSAP